MSGGLHFENHLQLKEHAAWIESMIPHALHEGAEPILETAIANAPEAPKKDGDREPHLKTTGRINDARGGDNSVGIEFTSIYARYIHENLTFKHIHGGGPKYLELAMIEKQDDALRKVADVLGDAR